MAKRTQHNASLAGVSLTTLQREIERRHAKGRVLRRKLHALHARAAKIESQLREYAALDVSFGVTRKGASPARRTAGGMPRRGSLAMSLQAVLRGKQMGVTEVAEAVKKAGYKTNSDNFRTIVNACLIKHKNLFKKIARGKYTAV
ncbi:MAG: hypothetical protein HBSAPP03_08710 [Phycisphaerae bacterium]|nr:MAG: hypothetical protein HBSAPP03_08710 [Phycisphaerae bacterium]